MSDVGYGGIPSTATTDTEAAATYVALAGSTSTGEQVMPDVSLTGITGAVTPARIVGGTASGPPTTGTFIATDAVITTAGNVWVCTVGGTPGTWAAVGMAGFVRKTADKSLTSNTTLEDDNHLTAPVVANATYTFEAFLIFDASTGGDIKIAFTSPTSSTINYGASGPATNASGYNPASGNYGTGAASGAAIGFGGVAVATKALIMARGLLRTAATAGSLTLQWAQLASDGTATTVYTDSFLLPRRVA